MSTAPRTPAILRLPPEILHQILSLVVQDGYVQRGRSPASALHALYVCRQLYHEAAALYYRHYVPVIEAWGCEERCCVSWWKGVKRWRGEIRKGVKLWWWWWIAGKRGRRRSAKIWSDYQLSNLRIPPEGPRNFTWLRQMPPLARVNIRLARLHGPCPRLATGHGLSSPQVPELYAAGRFCLTPQRRIMKFLREEMPDLREIEYYYCAPPTINLQWREDTEEEFRQIVAAREHGPVVRKLTILAVHARVRDVFVYELLKDGGHTVEELDIWVKRITGYSIERGEGTLRLWDGILRREIVRLRSIAGLKVAVRVVDAGWPGSLCSRVTEQEIGPELNISGLDAEPAEPESD